VSGKFSSILIAAVCCLGPVSGQAPYLHNHRPRLPHSQGPAVACLMVDLNSDGRMDLVRASKRGFGIFIQDAGGRYEAAAVAKAALTGTEIVSLAAGMITLGKFPDVVVGYRDGRVMVYPSSGGAFGKPWVLPKISGSLRPTVSEVLVGDLDNDGDDELVITLNQERPVVFSVVGTNVFKQARLLRGPLLQAPRSVLTDLDLDGDLDLLSISGGAPAYPGLYTNTRGAMTISSAAFPISTRIATTKLIAARVLGKASTELLIAPVSYSAAPVRIFRNTSSSPGKITYAPYNVTSAFAVSRPWDVVAGDVSGDGLPDLIAINLNGSVVVGVNSSTSPGSFRTALTLLSSAPRAKLCAVDLENDKDVDLYVAGAGVEDSLLLGNGSAGLLDRDTESRGMPIGRLIRALIGVTDLTGEGDPDLALWDITGRASMMRNMDGQARFERVANTKVPALPASVYIDVQSAAVASRTTHDFLVLGYVSINNATGMRTVVRRSTGQLIDETALRWRNTMRFVSMTVADIAGHVKGSVGTAGLSDVVGLDAYGNIVLVINSKGTFSRSVVVSKSRARVGSKVLVQDINLDKLPDLVILQPSSTVRVLLADPKNADRFVEIVGPSVVAQGGILEDVTGDLFPDLVLSVPSASSKVRIWIGLPTGRFLDRTSTLMPKLGTSLGIVTDIAAIHSSNTTLKSVVLGFQGGGDRIMRLSSRTFGAPELLPFRGSTKTRELLVRDLDLDGDDDVVVVRFDTYPALLLGQSFQFTHRGGLSQLGREASLHVALPDRQTFGVLGIGYPVVRFELPFMGVVRMGRFSVLMPMPNPPTKLIHEVRVKIPTSIGLTPIPMQMFTIKNAQIYFRNLDLFQPTRH
jgi:hypothetical protein